MFIFVAGILIESVENVLFCSWNIKRISWRCFTVPDSSTADIMSGGRKAFKVAFSVRFSNVFCAPKTAIYLGISWSDMKDSENSDPREKASSSILLIS